MVYNTELIRHARSNAHRGNVPQPDFSVVLNNSTCGDTLRISGKVRSRIFSVLKFEAKGCMLSQAAASLLIEKMLGEPIDSVQNFSSKDLVSLVAVDLGLTRQKCVLLSLDALKKGVADYTKKKTDPNA